MISVLFAVLAGFFNSVMDKLAHHFDDSIFRGLNELFWNPIVSHANKWKDRDRTKGEKFWGSSRWFVSLTDAWHLFKALMEISFALGIVFYTPITGSLFKSASMVLISDALILLIALNTSFHYSYHYILEHGKIFKQIPGLRLFRKKEKRS